MAALTTFSPSGATPEVATPPGAQRVFHGTVAGPSSYTTGGDTLDASKLGLVRVDHVQAGYNTTGTHFAVWDEVNAKLKIFLAPTDLVAGGEAASAANLGALLFPVTIVGA